MIHKTGFTLVLLMAILQGFYGIYAYIDPASFAEIRGTFLASQDDLDWVQIYASRTLFISLIIAALLYFKDYHLLSLAALFGSVMPITDGWLAYQAGAPEGVIAKHVVTLLYLLFTFVILRRIVKKKRAQ